MGTVARDRLAELVMHLSDCPAPLAQAAVNVAAAHEAASHQVGTPDDRLAVVAEALLTVRRLDLREQPSAS